jgi:Flp pilus assembly pilin Flp
MRRSLPTLVRDESGATMIEFTLVAVLFFIVTFGVVEFGYALWQWNAATKAVQLGARLAAVSDPVWSNLVDVTGGNTPGAAWLTDYDVTCLGATAQCTAPSGKDGGQAPTYSAPAMNRLVYGRGGSTVCGVVGADDFPGMCDIFPRIRPENVSVEYKFTGLGFSGRPKGPVPTIIVRMTNMQFQFFGLQSLLGFGPVDMPPYEVTMTGEDLNAAAP